MGSLPAASIFYPPGALALRKGIPARRATDTRLQERRILADWVRRKPTWAPDSVWAKVLAANGGLLQPADELAGIGGYKGFVAGLDYHGLLDEVAGHYIAAKHGVLGKLGQAVPEPGGSWDEFRAGAGDFWDDARRAFDAQATRVSVVVAASRDFGSRIPDAPGSRAIALADESQAFLEQQAFRLKSVVDGAARYSQSYTLARGAQVAFQKQGVRTRGVLQRRLGEYRLTASLDGIGDAGGTQNASRKRSLNSLAGTFRSIVRKSDKVDAELAKLGAKGSAVKRESKDKALKVVASIREYADISERRYGDISISRGGLGADPIEFYSAAGEKLMLEYKVLTEAMREVEQAAWRFPSPQQAGDSRLDEGDGVQLVSQGPAEADYEDILGIGEVTVDDETTELGDFEDEGGLYQYNPTHGARQPASMRSRDDPVPRFLGSLGSTNRRTPPIYRVMVINGISEFGDAMPQTLGDIVKSDYAEYDWKGGLYQYSPTHGARVPRGMGHRGPRGDLPRFFGGLLGKLPPSGGDDPGDPDDPIPPAIKKEIIKGSTSRTACNELATQALRDACFAKQREQTAKETERELAPYRAAEAAEKKRQAECDAKKGTMRATGQRVIGPTQGYAKLPDIIVHECDFTLDERRANCEKQQGIFDPVTGSCTTTGKGKRTCAPGTHPVCRDDGQSTCINDGDLLPLGWKQGPCAGDPVDAPKGGGGGPGGLDFGGINLGTLGQLALVGAAIVVVTLVGAIAVPSLMSAAGSVLKVKKQWGELGE